MRQLRAAWARLLGLFTGHRAEADDDLRAELESHLEMETAEFIRRGMAPAEARRQAHLASGGLTQAAEAVRERRGIPWLEGLAADIRFAFRSLRRTPAFTIVVVLTLALGIGANTAIFSVLRGVLLKPLVHRDGDRLVYLRHSSDAPTGASLAFSVPEVRQFRAGAPALGGIAEYSVWFHTLHDIGGESIRVDAGLVTGNFFEVLGLSPVLGRVTDAGDDGPGVPAVMVLTHEFWQQRFGGDSGVIGRQVRVDGGSATVIGVLQSAPFFPERVDVLLNMVISPHHTSAMMTEGHTHRMTELLARLAPGASLEQAQAEASRVLARMQAEHKDSYDAAANHRVAVIPFKDVLAERAKLTLWLLLGAAAFVLIISAANVVNLSLMRGVRREQEVVVRAALGAGRGRLRRLFLVENLVLTISGAALGVLLAVGGVRLLTAIVARTSPRANEIALDLVALGFTLLLAVLLALLLAVVSALPKEGTMGALVAGARRMTGGPRRHRVQRALVIAQVAVSVVLLAGAGLLTRTMLRLADVDTGYAAAQVLTVPLPLLDPSRFDPATDVLNKQRYERMRTEIRALPGVSEVGLSSTMPLRTSILHFDVRVDGKPLDAGQAIPRANLRTANPEYFRAAGIPLLKGREFSSTDIAGSAKVVIINETFARTFFPNEDPLGQRIAYTGDVLRFTPFDGEWRTIVGVVGNTVDGGLDAKPQLVTFLPFAQEVAVMGGLVIRTSGDAGALTGPVTRIVRRIAPGVPIENVLTVTQIKEQSVSPRRLNAALLSSFGILAVLIAAVGIGGVLAFSVSARTTEIGIRMSLGASASQVQRMILREGGVLLGIGLALGVGAAVLATQAIRGLLFGVAPHDPVTLALVAGAIGVIGLLACWIPARRAARIDPAITMRA